jgi:hypothetical protein
MRVDVEGWIVHHERQQQDGKVFLADVASREASPCCSIKDCSEEFLLPWKKQRTFGYHSLSFLSYLYCLPAAAVVKQ